MRKIYHLYLVVFILALCSLVYELILAQSMAAFLENTVLRYSVTIGLYMFSLGIGALWAEKKKQHNSLCELLKAEVGLTLIGGFSVVFLYWFDFLGLPKFWFSLLAHGLVIIVGLFSGLELPLLLSLASKQGENSQRNILAFNYFGAFAGTILFTFYFFPRQGLVASAFFIGGLNALAGLSLYFQNSTEGFEEKNVFKLLYVLLFLFCLVGFGWIFNLSINEYFTNQYLGV